MRPATAPMPREAMTASMIIATMESMLSIKAFIKRIMQPDMNAAIEPTERSMPPAVITKVAPMATMPMKEERARILLRLPLLRNASLTSTPMMKITTSAMKGPAVFRSSLGIVRSVFC